MLKTACLGCQRHFVIPGCPSMIRRAEKGRVMPDPLDAATPPGVADLAALYPTSPARPPARCPVCLGRGSMPVSFYDPPVPGTSTAPTTCRSCGGRGIV